MINKWTLKEPDYHSIIMTDREREMMEIMKRWINQDQRNTRINMKKNIEISKYCALFFTIYVFYLIISMY